ncbi:hypothetical protein OsI_01791 [Oryza sativa Indica Group]|uniref:GATA-type domain-containing protein n=1 Tax=Oryza sativa subsp. indica TaxID=39946 RepID=A2WPK9_ORYSI|nr:hypothetical protein OsI_01791 [Oryza sativa Indica Group]
MGSTDRKVVGIGVAEEGRRSCVECRATTTPMWRSGPTGPRSLCNACGIRYRKKRRQDLGLDLNQPQKQEHGEDPYDQRADVAQGSKSRIPTDTSKIQHLQNHRSLCNACGIRYRKKRRQDLGLDLNQPQKQEHGEVIPEVKDSNSNSNNCNSGSGNSSSNLQVVPKRRLLMGVEEAALLLMTLSSPSASTLLHG